MRSDYNERYETRILTYESLVTKNEELAEKRYKESNDIRENIQTGQYSEKEYQKLVARADRTMRVSDKADEEAGYYRTKIDRAQSNNMISSDDPDAIAKLKTVLDSQKDELERMKETNSIARNTMLSEEERICLLCEMHYSESIAKSFTRSDPIHGAGFPNFKIRNIKARIRYTEKRIAQLEHESKQITTKEKVGAITIRNSREDNRVQIFFDGTPSEGTRTFLKRHGFKWAPTVGAWQRYRSDYALQLAREAAMFENAALAAQIG